MRILFFLALTALLFFSCKKNSTVPGGSQTISGNLRYSDPAVDGAGLFYEEDNGNLLLFKNEFSDLYAQYLYYKDLVNVHSRLMYTATGDSSCLLGMVPGPCAHKIPLVEVKSLVKQ